MSNGRNEYGDIIDHEHHTPSKRPHMSRLSRAAQFSPFSALTGYDSLVAESARLTDMRKELTDDEMETLNAKFSLLQKNLIDRPTVNILHFVEDTKKAGGAFHETKGVISKIREQERVLIMESGEEIPIDDIVDLNCSLFFCLDFMEGETSFHE